MISTILRLLTPKYAIMTLLLLGVVQGTVTITKYPSLRNFFGSKEVVTENSEPEETAQSDEGLLAQIITSYHPAKRLIAWLVCYTLVCLALVPGIQMILESESNAWNGVMILGFTAFGGLLAYLLMAFRWSWGRGFLLLLAMGLSCGVFVALAGQLEKMRLDK